MSDSGINCLVALLRFDGIATDKATIFQRFRLNISDVEINDLVRMVKRHGLNSRIFDTRSWERLGTTPLPAIAARRDGSGFFVTLRRSKQKVLILDGHTEKPELLSRDVFEAIWDGSSVLITKRVGVGDTRRQFNIGWFLGAVQKYRSLLGEVLIASFMINIFGLVSPVFFQVVVDKVLVHRDISTLDVLIIGLVAVSIFESVLGGLRTYVFSHTTSRIDVELGARLFRHLLSLPLKKPGRLVAKRDGPRQVWYVALA